MSVLTRRYNSPRTAMQLRPWMLARLGRSRRRSVWGNPLAGVGLVGAGVLFGIGSLLLFAPGRISARLERRT